LVLGATNHPFDLDPAIRRRFQKRIYIPLPDEPARYFLLKHNLDKNNHSISDQDIKKFTQMTEGLSGSDLSNLMIDAAMMPMRRF